MQYLVILKVAKQTGHIKLVGSYGNVCYYEMKGRYYVRSKSSLCAKRVKTDKKFSRTMQEAGLLGRASRIASIVYNSLPASGRRGGMFRQLTGEASRLLRKGTSINDTLLALCKDLHELSKIKQVKHKKQPDTERVRLKLAKPLGRKATRRWTPSTRIYIVVPAHAGKPVSHLSPKLVLMNPLQVGNTG